jgi:hypothetical protein
MIEFIRGARAAERTTLTPAAWESCLERGGEGGVAVTQDELHAHPRIV